MEREIMHKLIEWKNSPYRKPLILKGVRQVGKTWILNEFENRFLRNRQDKTKLRIRFSLDNLKLDDDILNIPLFMLDQTKDLLSLALKEIATK